jgi:hypothetical protein
MVGFSAWSLPDGVMTSVIVVGTDIAAGGLSPWNVVEGTVQSLTTPGTVAVDRSYSDRLGVSGRRRNWANSRPAGNGWCTHGRHSFFHDDALCILRCWGCSVLHRIAGELYQSFSRSAEAKNRYRADPSEYSFEHFRHPGAHSGSVQTIKADRSGFSEQEPARHSLRARCSAIYCRHCNRRTDTLFQHQRPSL